MINPTLLQKLKTLDLPESVLSLIADGGLVHLLIDKCDWAKFKSEEIKNILLMAKETDILVLTLLLNLADARNS